MPAKGTIILVSLLTLLLGSHLLLFLCATRFMRRDRRLARALLLLVLLLLPFAFPASWVWNSIRPGMLPAVVHACASVWLGFVLNCTMALAVVSLVGAAARLLRRRYDPRALILISVVAAFAATAYGFVNAKSPRVTEVEVAIRDLPANWEGKTIVQLSDMHLGVIHGKGFLGRIVRRVNDLDPDLVVVTGDLFDGLAADCTVFSVGLRRLRSRKGNFFVTGNHEGYLGPDKAVRALRNTGIRVLNDEVVEVDGLQLVGMSYPVHGGTTGRGRPFRVGGNYRRDLPAILLYHTPTALGARYGDHGSQQLSAYFFPDPDFSHVRDLGIDLQLSGHTHAGQTFPFGLLSSFLFKGFDRGLHKLGDFSIYISAGTGTWGPPMRVGRRGEIVLVRLRSLPVNGGGK